MTTSRFSLCAAALCLAGAASADEFSDAMQDYFHAEIESWAADPALVEAILAQNATTSGYDQARIDELDAAWQSEVGAAASPTIDTVLDNDLADWLRERIAASDGAITELFVMDAVGLNVAASDVTSDMWQGDEAKWQETYGAGPGALHLGEVELDESSGQYQGQISVAIVDPATNDVIGAMTVGVNAEKLM